MGQPIPKLCQGDPAFIVSYGRGSDGVSPTRTSRVEGALVRHPVRPTRAGKLTFGVAELRLRSGQRSADSRGAGSLYYDTRSTGFTAYGVGLIAQLARARR